MQVLDAVESLLQVLMSRDLDVAQVTDSDRVLRLMLASRPASPHRKVHSGNFPALWQNVDDVGAGRARSLPAGRGGALENRRDLLNLVKLARGDLHH